MEYTVLQLETCAFDWMLYSSFPGEVAQEEEEEVDQNSEGPDIGVLARLYAVHTK